MSLGCELDKLITMAHGYNSNQIQDEVHMAAYTSMTWCPYWTKQPLPTAQAVSDLRRGAKLR